ncbi:MAG TPA: LamG-like jellyroll fold domain-containing protein [Verrucomicrobiae bacterium]|nr:LamG-like jellyroll fold domain-containing protein [Verrucomicrobiae bacterium]
MTRCCAVPPEFRRLFLGLILLSALALRAQVNVLTYHNDVSRTGQNTNETVLTPANVNTNSFGKLFAYPLDGQVFAQPLYVSGLNIPGQGTHNVVFVATMHDSVYALDADSNLGANGGVLWQVSLGTSAATPNNDFGNRYGAYHDIRPEVGIIGTPVIDLATSTLYLDAFTHEGTNYVHRIHALSLVDGSERANSPVVVSAAITGAGVDSSGGMLAFDPVANGLQRPALTLAGGVLYVLYSGFADTNPYHGWVLGFDAQSLQQLTNSIFNTTPNSTTAQWGGNAGEGGLWMGGNGLSVDSATNVYLMVANGIFNANTNGTEYSDSFLRLSTTNGLAVADYFTPYDQATLAANDTDLGSGGPVLLPDEAGSAAHPHLIVGSGKSGKIYLVDRDAMGHFNAGGDSQIVQTVSGALGSVFSTPAYFNQRLYYQPVGDHLKMLTISNATVSAAVISQSAGTIGFPGATPSISANGTNNAIVWVLDNSASSSGSPIGPAVLHAYDAYNLTRELYNSGQAGARDAAAWAVKHAVPTIANGKVYVGGALALSVYGAFNFSNTFITITAPPTNTLAVQAATATLAVGAVAGYVGGFTNGPAPPVLSYQWQRAPAGSAGFTNIPGAIANTYVTPLLSPGDNGAQFRVVLATTGAAATSAVASVTILSNTVPPLPVRVVAVNQAATAVTVAFSQPLDPASAQTLGNYVFAPGNLVPTGATLDATGTNLTLSTSVALPQNTTVTLNIANVRNLAGTSVPGGTSISFSFVVAGIGAYASTVLGDQPLGYWRLNEASGPTAVDATGNNNGAYASAATPGVPGPRPPTFLGFESGNTAVETYISTLNSYVSVPFGSLSTNTVTFVSWLYPIGLQESWAGLLMTRGGGTSGGMGYNAQQMLVYTWNNNSSATYNFNSGLVIPSNQWSMVAMVIYPSEAILYLGTNGVLRSATNTLAHTSDVFGNNWQIGHDNNGGDASRTFNGMIDEVAVFAQSVAPAELARYYQAALQGGVQITNIGVTPATLEFTSINAVSGQVVLQWLGVGTLQEAPAVLGPWTNSTSQGNPTVAPIVGNRFYRLHR